MFIIYHCGCLLTYTYIYVYIFHHAKTRSLRAMKRVYEYSSKNFAPTLFLLQQKNRELVNRENKARVVVYSAHIQQEHPHFVTLGTN